MCVYACVPVYRVLRIGRIEHRRHSCVRRLVRVYFSAGSYRCRFDSRVFNSPPVQKFRWWYFCAQPLACCSYISSCPPESRSYSSVVSCRVGLLQKPNRSYLWPLLVVCDARSVVAAAAAIVQSRVAVSGGIIPTFRSY